MAVSVLILVLPIADASVSLLRLVLQFNILTSHSSDVNLKNCVVCIFFCAKDCIVFEHVGAVTSYVECCVTCVFT
jgi:hypothetical protein